jgi:PAS domain S-box-containing protein
MQLLRRELSNELIARRQAETDIDRFFDLSLDMLCIADAEGYFVRLSPAFTRTLGWSLEELMSRPFLDFVHPDDRASTLLEVERQIGRGEPVLEFQNRYRHQDGSWRLLSWKSSPHTDGSLYAIARDVTDREQAAQALRRSHEELEHRVQERTAELQQRNSDLETLLYVSSHDLREPLRSISNFSQLVRERYGDRLDAKGIDYIDRVIRAAQRMDQLMEDLLTLSRAQRLEMPYEEVRGDDLARAALTQLDETIRRTGAHVRVAAEFPSFRVNKTWVTQALYNLIANALKFHQPGAVPEIELAPYRLMERRNPQGRSGRARPWNRGRPGPRPTDLPIISTGGGTRGERHRRGVGHRPASCATARRTSLGATAGGRRIRICAAVRKPIAVIDPNPAS